MVKLKFGVFLPFYAFQAKTPNQHFNLIKDTVLECERLGYDSAWIDDHLMYNNWPILECFSTLSALASLTSKIRLGSMVACTLHRNPGVLAKTAATLDVLSNGRFELGVGAGIQQAEHDAYGFDFPKPSGRVERLGEALEVIRLLWTQPKASYTGKHYQLKDAFCEPKPLQKPHPSVIVGGSGDKILEVTAKYADRFDWGYLPTELYKRKLAALEVQCRMVGRNFEEIEKSCWPGGQVLIASSQRELEEKIRRLKGTNETVEEFKIANLAGTPQEVIERLHVFVDLGVTYFMLYFPELTNLDGLRLFYNAVAMPMRLEVSSGDMR